MPSRCFLAFDLPDEAVHGLCTARDALVELAPDWAGEKWVDPRLLHVTLKFIGAFEDAAVPEAVSALLAACAPLRVARLAFGGVRAVPSARRAKMLWATLTDVDGSMSELASTVDELLAAGYGVQPSERGFAPHVTLARARRQRSVPPSAVAAATEWLASVSKRDGPMSVRSITLYSSTLGPAGPTYERLARIPVGSD